MSKIKKQYYDSNTDTLWAVFKGGPEAGYEELAPGVNVEYDKNSRIIGLEIQNLSRFYDFKPTTEERKENYLFSKIGTSKNIPNNYRAFISS
jgi:uncharacterized protein YuzE